MKRLLLTTTLLATLSSGVSAANFELTVLGSKGGIEDGNLTSFLLRSEMDKNYVTLDAGTIINGLNVANKQGAFDHVDVPNNSEYGKVGYILREKIKGYVITHSHLDHISGLIIASPEDTKKNIYGSEKTNKAIADTYFNWTAWPNFGNTGKGYKIGQYQYVNVDGSTPISIAETSLNISSLAVNHPAPSSAFFITDNENTIAFFGDTGPDKVEKTESLKKVWTQLAPIQKSSKLNGLVIEVSFANATPDKALFGHLTPNWLITELKRFEQLSGGKGSLKGLKIVISHIKYGLKKGEDPKAIIKKQLDELNDLGVEFIIPTQGEQYRL
ncbi:3',5'-cyclic-nucleotide phosphodiesterase [Vibrio sp. SS-MA-C1-2]|uniref:MBL fold metallo-hydrolase n=1 Tax=Vibrio sp. SS-MA-C1-2 TaxID=2908646 RepID=UPI001F333E51|nr:3',5'-cyclic-nucleotide phosphodiesterase [Vibrio sp. SS-MA-C1-2]UJF17004.1 3',5'-cyclic-nucleotide phosphodiesterase [Vibrio sp. SS-MA-C1-2]